MEGVQKTANSEYKDTQHITHYSILSSCKCGWVLLLCVATIIDHYTIRRVYSITRQYSSKAISITAPG